MLPIRKGSALARSYHRCSWRSNLGAWALSEIQCFQNLVACNLWISDPDDKLVVGIPLAHYRGRLLQFSSQIFWQSTRTFWDVSNNQKSSQPNISTMAIFVPSTRLVSVPVRDLTYSLSCLVSHCFNNVLFWSLFQHCGQTLAFTTRFQRLRCWRAPLESGKIYGIHSRVYKIWRTGLHSQPWHLVLPDPLNRSYGTAATSEWFKRPLETQVAQRNIGLHSTSILFDCNESLNFWIAFVFNPVNTFLPPYNFQLSRSLTAYTII